MTARPRKRTPDKKRLAVWTIACLAVVIICALLLRGVVLYHVYPIDFENEIARYSEEFGLDPHLVCAVINAESGFDDSAVSPKGAIGLMQVMPDTGAWAAEKIGVEGFYQDDLFFADTSIRIGCWYLSYLDGEFSGDIDLMLAAYNAGPARVREWLGGGSELTEIPYKETENYLKKVKHNLHMYKGLYDEF